jgi:hypothetical protein
MRCHFAKFATGKQEKKGVLDIGIMKSHHDIRPFDYGNMQTAWRLLNAGEAHGHGTVCKTWLSGNFVYREITTRLQPACVNGVLSRKH